MSDELPASVEKPKTVESAGDETGQAVGAYGTAATWTLLDLPVLTGRILLDHPLFFGSMVVASCALSAIPSNSSFLSLLITLMVISGTLRAIDSRADLSGEHIWTPIRGRIGTLIGAQILVWLMLFVFGGLLWFLVAQADFIRLGGPDTILWMLVFGPPVAFALSLSFFLAVAVLDGQEGVVRSLWQAVRLYLVYLPGNLVVVLGTFVPLFAGVFVLAMVLPEPVGMIAGTVWAGTVGTLGNVVASLRWRQLRALEA